MHKRKRFERTREKLFTPAVATTGEKLRIAAEQHGGVKMKGQHAARPVRPARLGGLVSLATVDPYDIWKHTGLARRSFRKIRGSNYDNK